MNAPHTIKATVRVELDRNRTLVAVAELEAGTNGRLDQELQDVIAEAAAEIRAKAMFFTQALEGRALTPSCAAAMYHAEPVPDDRIGRWQVVRSDGYVRGAFRYQAAAENTATALNRAAANGARR